MKRFAPWQLLLPLLASLATAAHAQWSSEPALNLAIGDAPSDQAQAKIRATSDGGCYISWLDGIGTGWDVRLQRLNQFGVEQWTHNGVLVADLGLSSTTDYGLAVDGAGNAILAFQDTRFGGTRITCAKVSPAGSLVWGANGVQVSIGSGVSPHVAALSDGHYVVGWTEGSNLRRQKLDANGSPQWAAGGMFEAPPAGNSDLICDVIAAERGNVMISWSRNPSRFLHAQKYDAAGAPVWNAGAPVVVFNGSALQFGYFPTFLHDGAGGAVFGWYETGGVRNAYIQRLTAAGAEMYPHNGVAVSTNTAGRIRLSPHLLFNSSNGETFLFWTESTTPVQNMWGLYGQKFDAAGARQWSDSARELIPLSSSQNSFVRSITSGAGAMVFCFDQSGPARVIGMGLDGAGNFIWNPSIVEACSVLSGKSRLDIARSTTGAALLAWSDARTDAGDIYAQNVNPNGTLGNLPQPGDVNGDFVVDVNDLLMVVGSWGTCPPVCPADLNGDGMVDVNDLLMVIGNWD